MMKAYFWRVGVYLLVGIIGITFLLPANLFAQRGKEVDYKLLRRDIEVMVGVINTMLKESWEERERIYYVSWRNGECKGFHLNGYGIVFTLNLPVSFHIRTSIAVQLKALETLRDIKVAEKAAEKQKEEQKKTTEEITRERLTSLKEQLIDIFGNYGDFIKQVPPEGYITTVVFFGGSTDPLRVYKRMILTFRRGNISDYRNGKISMEEFKKRVQYVEY